MEEKNFTTNVKGIYCRQCSEIITEHLMQTRGIIDVDIAFYRAEVSVVYDPGILSETGIREALSSIGYPPCEKGAPGSNPVLNALTRPFRTAKR